MTSSSENNSVMSLLLWKLMKAERENEWEVTTVGWKASAKGTKVARITLSEVVSSADALFYWLWTLTWCSPLLHHWESHPTVNATNSC